jgi:hypothetical protein
MVFSNAQWMTPPASDSVVSVANSALFDSDNSEYLARTPSATGVEEKGTFSGWIYRGKQGFYYVFTARVSDSQLFQIYFATAGQLLCGHFSSGIDWQLTTTRVFRDVGWYHVVLGVDTTQSIASDRAKLYINGVQITDFDVETYPSLNFVNDFNTSGVANHIGSYNPTPANEFDGYMAEVVWIDGTQYTASNFGNFDSTGTFWTPKSSAVIQELTFGTNGFYLANKVTDQPQLDFQAGDDNTLANSQIKSLLHFDGSDASTTFTDSSSYGPTWTAAGNAQLDTAQKKFGTASLLLDGTGDSISTPSLGLPGTDPFTIDMWVRRNGANTNNGIFSFGVTSGGTSNQQIRLLTSTDNKLIISTNDAGVIGTSDHSTSLPDGEFAHVAVTRSGNTIYLFQNGTLLASTSFSYNLIDPNPYYIGNDIGAANNFNGHVDEFRVILGECKYTANFSVETSAYSNPPTANNLTNYNTVTTNTHTPTNIFNLFNTLDHTTGSNFVLSNGNQTADADATNKWGTCTLPVATGKWFAVATTTDVNSRRFGVVSNEEGLYDLSSGVIPSDEEYAWAVGLSGNTTIAARNDSSNITGTIQTIDRTEDRYVVAIDCDNKKLWLGVYDQSAGNIQYVDSGGTVRTTDVPASGSNETYTLTGTSWRFFCEQGDTGTAQTIDFGQNSFNSATVPSGFNTSLSTTSIASATSRTKTNLEEYFDSTLYEGNGAVQRVGKFLPFTNSYTVGNGAMFIGANSEDLSRGSMSGTATTFTVSMWVKRAEPAVGGTNANFMFTTASDAGLSFSNNSTADVLAWYSGSYTATTRVFNDQSSWMNVVFKSDSGTGTAYVNGVEMLSSLTVNGADATMAIGSYNNSSNFWDGYMAEVVMIDGTALEPSSFGQVDTSTGRWIPKDVSGLTFGTNGFYLNFANSSDVGNDVSGNNNDFTNNNTVVQVGDTPTVNFGTLNVSGGAATVTNGNRTNTGASGGYGNVRTSLTFGNEKIFAMLLINDGGSGASVNTGFSVAPDSYVPDFNNAPQTGTYANVQTQGTITRVVIGDAKGGTVLTLTHSIAVADGDYLTMAVDPANGAVWFGIYDTSASSHQYLPAVVGGTAGDPANGTLPTVTNLPFNNSQSCIMSGGFGTSSSSTIVFNSADMPMSLPTDYLEFKQDNLATGESYQTAFSWIKNRDATDNHMLFDRVRGISNNLHSNTQDAEDTNVNSLQRFLNGGVQVGNDVQVNTAAESYVAWNWYFETTGSGSSNTDGTINTTSTLVDTNLGLSISKYTGTGA